MQKAPPYRKPTDAEHVEAARQGTLQRHDRQPASGGRVAALDKLNSRLVANARLYESGDLQSQRDAVADTLLGVGDYLTAQGFAGLALAPLMRPVYALVERENNSLDLMFTQRARGGRPKSTLMDHERSGILAGLAEEWLRTHAHEDRPQRAKLTEAARYMKGRWFDTVTCAQLETARELVSQEAESHPAVIQAKMVREWCSTGAEMFGTENAFPILVRMLNDVILPFGMGEGGILKTPRVSPAAKD